MKDIKIGYKLIAAFLFTAAITAFMGIYLVSRLNILGEENNILYERGSVPLGMLVKTAEKVQQIHLGIWKWQRAESEEARTEIIKSMEESYALVKELIDRQKELVLVETGKKVLENLQFAVDKFMAESQNYAENAKIHPITGWPERISFYPGVTKAAEEMSKALETAIETRVGSTKVLSDKALKVVDRSRNVTIALLIATILISIGLGLLLTFSIMWPFNKVIDILSRIEKGDMTARVDMERGDELGTLSDALDSLSTRLQGIFKNLRQDSDTLSNTAEELSTIGKQVANIAEKNVSQSATVAGTAEQASLNINAMASGAEQASANTNEVASAAEQMSFNMNTIATAIEEMSSSIRQISSNAGDANNVAHEATVKSKEATDVMGKLGVAAKEIGKVTDVIKKIANKTNLLALNATIEAASAGAAGKGFAVVASEIKELANQSSASADDIAKRIEDIQIGTGNAVTVIDDVSDIITKINNSVEAISNHVSQQTKASNEIASNVAQANTGAKRVASAINEVANGSRDIARNASEAARGSIVISESVVGITQGAKDSAQGANQINKSAGELAKIAGELNNVLSQFMV